MQVLSDFYELSFLFERFFAGLMYSVLNDVRNSFLNQSAGKSSDSITRVM